MSLLRAKAAKLAARVFAVLLLLMLCHWPVMAQPDGSTRGTGFVRLEKIGEVWTFVDADGKPFFSAGANHAQIGLYLKPTNKAATVERYGKDLLNEQGWFDKASPAFAKFIDAQIAHLRSWKFNTFGYHTNAEIFDRLPDDVFFIASFSPIKSQAEYHQSKTPRPDPFDPGFAAEVESKARKVIERYRNRRNLIGYAWTDGFGMNLLQLWAQELRNRDAASAAKKVWIEILKRKYPDAAAAARAYNIKSADTWDSLVAFTDWKFHNPPTDEEREFKNRIIAKYYEVVSGVCRRLDPNHLVLGDKARKMNPDEIAAIAPYVDLFFFESYAFGENTSAMCSELARHAGKPVLFGDGGFGFRRPERIASGEGPHPDGGKGRQFPTQNEAGLFYAKMMKALSENPNVLGWHYCGFIEEYDHPDAPATKTDPNENGFMDPFEKDNEDFLRRVRPANEAAIALRASLRPASSGNASSPKVK